MLCLSGLSSEQVRAGDQDPSQEAVVLQLSTAASRQLQAPPVVPYLPSGSLCSGLPAAVLSYCQARGMAADLLVSVDMVPSLASMSLTPLALAASTLLARNGKVADASSSLISAACLKDAGSQLSAALGGSAAAVFA